MLRFTHPAALAALLAACLAAPPARADAFLVPLDGSGKDVNPADYGYRVRSTPFAHGVDVLLTLSPEAARSVGNVRLHLTRGGRDVLDADLHPERVGPGGQARLKFSIDTRTGDGGELIIWSRPIKGAPLVHNFGGFRLSVKTLLGKAP